MSKVRNHIAFTATLLITSAFMVFMWMMQLGLGMAISAGVVSTFVLVTLLLALATGYIQLERNQAAFNQKQKTGASLATHQTRTIELDIPFEQAFALALDALQNLDEQAIPKSLLFFQSRQKLKVHYRNPEMGRIEAGLRAKTLGIPDIMDFSKINVQLQRLDASTTQVLIESDTTNPLEFVDMARHTHYVNQLAVQMRQAVAAKHLQADTIAAPAQSDADTSQTLRGQNRYE